MSKYLMTCEVIRDRSGVTKNNNVILIFQFSKSKTHVHALYSQWRALYSHEQRPFHPLLSRCYPVTDCYHSPMSLLLAANSRIRVALCIAQRLSRRRERAGNIQGRGVRIARIYGYQRRENTEILRCTLHPDCAICPVRVSCVAIYVKGATCCSCLLNQNENKNNAQQNSL